MELIVLKIRPDQLDLMAGAIQRDIDQRPLDDTTPELTQILAWLRYRHGKWLARQSVARQTEQQQGTEPPDNTKQ